MSKVLEGAPAVTPAAAAPETSQSSFAERQSKWTSEQRQKYDLTGDEPEYPATEEIKPAATPEGEAPKVEPGQGPDLKQEPKSEPRDRSWRKDRKIGELSAENRRLQRELDAAKSGKPSSNAPAENKPGLKVASVEGRPKLAEYTAKIGKADGPVDYEDAIDQHAEALADWKYETRDKTRKTEEQERETSIEQEEIEDEWQDRWKVAAKDTKMYPEFEKVAFSDKLGLNPTTIKFIQRRESGPAVLYHLGKDLELATRIAKFDADDTLIELGKIELALSKAPKPNTVTKAPNPPANLGGKDEGSEGPKVGSRAWIDAENAADAKRLLGG